MASIAKTAKVKLVIQQCLSARLKLPRDSEEGPESAQKTLEIARGMVVFVCFLKGAETADAVRAAKTVLGVKLCEAEADADNPSTKTKRSDVLGAGGDLLVVPQATLGGKLKGKSLQYHDNIAKDEGIALYDSFNAELKSGVSQSSGSRVESGIYGARQILNVDTNGPFTHVFEL